MNAPTADDLVRDLILRRFAERFEPLPYSAGHHILHCDSRTITDTASEEGVVGLCGTCEDVTFTARVACGHTEVMFEFGEAGRMDQVLAELAELAEEQEAARA